ncbi:MAG: tetratricopeptide repeat protein [Nitrolancea sp.]
MSSQTTTESLDGRKLGWPWRPSHYYDVVRQWVRTGSLESAEVYISYVAILGIVAWGAWLRFNSLTNRSVWSDESITARRQIDYRIQDLFPSLLTHRTFGYLTTHYAFAWFGPGDFSLRLVPALLGTIGIFATFVTARKLFRSSIAGLIAASLMSISTLHLYQSQFGRFYPGLMLFSLLATVSIFYAVKTGRTWIWIAFCLATVVNLYNQLFGGFVLLSTGLWAVMMLTLSIIRPGIWLERRTALKRMAQLCAAGLVIFVLYLPATINTLTDAGTLDRLYINHSTEQQPATLETGATNGAPGPGVGFRDQVHGFDLTGNAVQTIREFSPTGVLGPTAFVSLFFIGLLSLGLGRRWDVLILICLMFATPFFVLAVFNTGHFFKAYYVIFLLPFYLICIGYGIKEIARLAAVAVQCLTFSPMSALTGALFSIGVSLAMFTPIMIGSHADLKTYFRNQSQFDSRGAATFIDAERKQGDSVVMLDNTYFGGFSFYSELLVGQNLDQPTKPTMIKSIDRANLQLRRNRRLWIVADPWGFLSADPDVYQWLLTDSFEVSFRGVTVFLKSRNPLDLSSAARIEMLEEAMRVRGQGNSEIPVQLGDLYADQGDWQHALALYDEALNSNPDGALPLRRMGQVFENRGDWYSALAIYQRMTQRWPNVADYYVFLGNTYQQLGETERAMDAYRRAGEVDGSQGTELVAIGYYYLRINDLSNSLLAFQRAAQLEPQDPQGWIGVATVEQQLGNTSSFDSAYQRALPLTSNDASTMVTLARLKLKQGSYQEAERVARMALDLAWRSADVGTEAGWRNRPWEKVPSGVVSAHLLLGNIAMEQRDWATAQSEFEAAANFDPYGTDPLLALGLLSAKQHDLQGALTYYQNAAELAPGSVDVHARLASIYGQLGEVDKAIAEYQTLVSINANEPSYQLSLAETLQDAGRIADAEPVLQDLINQAEKLGPQPALARVYGSPSTASKLAVYAQAYDYMGNIVRDQAIQSASSLESARRLYQRGLTFNPDEPSLYDGLSELYLADRRVDDSVSTFEQYAAIAPPSADVQTELGVLYRRAGRMSDSEAAYRRALQMDPSSYNAYIQLGSLLSAIGKESEAKDLYQQAASVLPNNGGAYKRLGDLSLQENEVSDALSFYLEAITRNPDHAPSYVAIGDLYRASGDVANARSWYERALQIKPDEEYIQRRLSDISGS